MKPAPSPQPSLVEALLPPGREMDGPVAVTEGRIPPGLQGTLYHNRPGEFSVGGLRYRHWLDGNGLISALHLKGGSPWFRSRFVATRKRTEEGQIGAPKYRTFGTSFPGDRLQMGLTLESPANLHTIWFDKKLYALGEQGMPWEIDPDTLETRGEASFSGALSRLTPFSAHGKVHGGELLNFGIEYHPTQPKIHVHRLGKKKATAAHVLDGPRAVHDFAVTTKHLVLYLPPYFLEMENFLAGSSVAEALRWQPERGLKIWLVDRQSLQVTRRVDWNPHYAIHLVNAFESPEGTHLDVIEYDHPLYGEYWLGDFCPRPLTCELARYTFYSDARVQRRLLSPHRSMLDFPVVDGAHLGEANATVWGLSASRGLHAGEKFFDELWRWTPQEEERFRLPPGAWFSGDPIPAGPWLLVFVASAGASEYWIFAADNLTGGPVAKLRLPAPIPIPVHGTFRPLAVS